MWSPQELEAINILQELQDEQQETSVGKSDIKFAPRSKRFPPLNLYPNIDLFVHLVSEEFHTISRTIPHDNLTREQRDALKQLQRMKQVLIKPADKGGNLVIWPRGLYEREAFRQLRDQQCYQRLSFNPTISFQGSLRHLLDTAASKGTISRDTYNFLMVENPSVACMYLLPKIHKNSRIPPGRPIVSGNGGLCEPLCKFIDSHLKTNG